MKKLRYVLLILLMMIIMPSFAKAVNGAGARFGCAYEFTMSGSGLNDSLVPKDQKNKDYHWLANFLFAVTDDSGDADEKDGPYDMNIYVDLYRDGTLIKPKDKKHTDMGENGSSAYIEHDGGEARYNGNSWRYFFNLYVTGLKTPDMKIGNETAQAENQTQKCPAKIYVKKRGTRLGFNVNNTSNDGNYDIEATLVEAPRLTCHYAGFVQYDWDGSSDDDWLYFPDIPLYFYSDFTSVGYDAREGKYKPTWNGHWKMATLDHITPEGFCQQPSGLGSDPNCQYELANRGQTTTDGQVIYKGKAKLLLTTARDGQYWDKSCPTSFETDDSAGKSVAHINVQGGKSSQEGIRYTGQYDCYIPSGDPTLRDEICPKGNEQGFEEYEIEKPHTYLNVNICDKNSIEYIQSCGCMPASLTDLTSRIYLLLKITAPALLLIVGGFEMVKAMTASDESAIKKAQQKLIKKFVAAAMVFLLMTVIQFLAALLGTSEGTMQCVDYILNGYQV